MECPICIEKITPSKRVECNLCNYVACSKCIQTYLLHSADDPHCLKCKRIWDREALFNYLPKAFINSDLKKHRENMLLERETAMMTSTQPYVEQEIQRRNNVEVLMKLQNERNILKKKLNEINRACFDVQRNINPPLQNEKRAFIHKCGNDGCRGFLSMQWKCNICNMYTCNECNILKGPEKDSPHQCIEADKATMQLLKNDCKKCPGCAQYIFKIDGCDQMWCINCHTAFSWRTGLIINGTIHNPHFYDFQRNHGNGVVQRQLGDIPCGGVPSYRDVTNALQPFVRSYNMDILLKIHRITAHIEQVELPRFAHIVTVENNIDLRVKYMLNELSSEHFKSKIQQREKAFQKKREIGMILNMYIITISDYLREIIYQKEISPYIFDIIGLINYTNTSLIAISKRYDCVVLNVNNQFRIVNATYKMKYEEVRI